MKTDLISLFGIMKLLFYVLVKYPDFSNNEVNNFSEMLLFLRLTSIS